MSTTDLLLAPYAMHSHMSRGRVHPESPHPFRTAFQRDRDRIIHSTAFRRLEYKTQVFVNHEGDYYRTRLTHTMEAAQVTRTIAKVLGLDEDLAEGIALAHDLGHTPFGHAGERTLNELMKDHGGFEHNRQSLRIVEVLEERYPAFVGLNLSWEMREGIVKHSLPYDKPLAADFAPGEAPALEAQLVDLTDEIAYNSHDIDDGLKSGLITLDQLQDVRLWRDTYAAVRKDHPATTVRIWRFETIRRLIDRMATDLIENVRAGIAAHAIASVDEVRALRRPLATFTPDLDAQRLELKRFLYDNLYRHHRVVRMILKAQRVLKQLFEAYIGEPQLLPPHILGRRESAGESLPRVIADYIAGMTDRFAFEEHRKLYDPQERV